MTGIIRVKCPKCKEWMRQSLDLCADCIVTQIKIKEEEE